jgi:hypothetical protein
VGHERIKTEYAGAKNGDGAWMTRAAAKRTAKHNRRQIDKRSAAAGRLRGLFASIAPDASLADELIADRRAEVRTEDTAEVERKAAGTDRIGALAPCRPCFERMGPNSKRLAMRITL